MFQFKRKMPVYLSERKIKKNRRRDEAFCVAPAPPRKLLSLSFLSMNVVLFELFVALKYIVGSKDEKKDVIKLIQPMAGNFR